MTQHGMSIFSYDHHTRMARLRPHRHRRYFVLGTEMIYALFALIYFVVLYLTLAYIPQDSELLDGASFYILGLALLLFVFWPNKR